MTRTENKAELLPVLEDIVLQKTNDEWTVVFEKAKLPHSPVNNIESIMQHPQVKARNMIVETEGKEIGKIGVAGNPIKMTNIPESSYREKAPEVGEHNAEIYSEMLELSQSEIKELKDAGVI